MSKPLPACDSRPLDGGPSFSLANRVERLAWTIAWTCLARWTPRPLFGGWRCAVLRLFGAHVGKGCAVAPDVVIWLPRNLMMADRSTLASGVQCYNMAPVTLGAGAIVSQRAFLCAGSHDYRDPEFQLVTAPITIGPKAWVAAEAFVGPGVEVGEGAVLAARGCAVRNLDSWTVFAGNPAKPVRRRVIHTRV